MPPSVHCLTEKEKREQSNPERSQPKGKQRQTNAAYQSNETGDFQTANLAQRKPKQGPKDLTAIEWIDRKQVKDKQQVIHKANRLEEMPKIRRQTGALSSEENQRSKKWYQGDIDQRPGGDAP